MRLSIFALTGPRVVAMGVLIGCGLLGGELRPAAAAIDLTRIDSVVGRWDMSLDDTERRCEMTFRSDLTDPGYVVAMPAGCRRAMPILADVRAWKAVDPSRLDLEDETGATVIEFTPGSGAELTAKGPEGETYELVATSGAIGGRGAYQVAQQGAAPAAPAVRQAAAAPVAAAGAKSIADTAGRYAILRQGNKDTGCLLTLETTGGGPKGRLRALLAPACRDQGILIFDPVGWQIEKGNRITLTARKGQLTHLDLQPDGTWAKDPKDGTPLFLKRM